ncbi:deoxynucleotidyltransferase terminal-interacting protein 2 [Salminus brasiliensis]|uniref:deoxynucleotidyltransferase terminal-interacting protein 2 n=1 Tax=Salminus brasiliensis TaxID=930266 RepID=UPI003B82C6D8
MLSIKMVATRRGTRVASPERKSADEVAEPTPTVRKTRSRTVIVTEQSQSEQTSDSQQDDAEVQHKTPAKPATAPKRDTRRSKRQPAAANQPDSTHEADVSESESCCSVASDVLVQSTTRSRRRTAGREKAAAATEQDASEGESSATASKKSRRSVRSQKKPASVPAESAASKDSDHSEAESCSSVASLSKMKETRMITRSRRRTTGPTEDADPSEADSCSSAVSGPQGSTVRRSTRSRRTKPSEPIPIHLEESEPTEASVSYKTRRAKGKSADEDQVYESEGCHSGPSLSPWRKAGVTVLDSDSESLATTYISLDSPCSLRVRLTPCSSRTGSAGSNRAVPASRTRSSVKVTHNVSYAPSVASEGEIKEDQAEILMDTTSQSVNAAVSDREDIEDMEEDEECNKTVISADGQECSILDDVKADLTLTLDEDISNDGAEAQMESESSSIRGVTVSENTENMEDNHGTKEQADAEKSVKSMEESEKMPKPVKKIHVIDDQASAVVMKPEKGVIVTEECQPNLVKDHDVEEQKSSDPVQTEKSVKLVDESEEKVVEKSVTVIEEANDSEATMVLDVAQKIPASQTISVTYSGLAGEKVENEKDKVEDMSSAQDEEGPSSSKPEKGVVSLLDSSEDEESDDEGLSDKDCKEVAGNLEGEDEVMCLDENQPGPSREPDSSKNNGLFVIDARPGLHSSETYYIDTTCNEEENKIADSKAAEDEEDFVDEEGDDDDDEDSKVLFTTRRPARTELSSAIDPGLKVKDLGGLYISFDGSKSKSVSNNLKKLKDQKNQDELLKKSVIVADFEKQDAVPPYKESKHAAKLKRKEEKAKTTGDGWFNMRAPELTDELKNDLKALQMRSAMDPKRFYKKNDREGFPKYFQVGTVVDNPADFYHSRIPKKERKRTIVEELLADAEFRSFNKRKYQEIMSEKAAESAGKMNKKKHTFHKKK